MIILINLFYYFWFYSSYKILYILVSILHLQLIKHATASYTYVEEFNCKKYYNRPTKL